MAPSYALGALGITAIEESVYRALLGGPGATLESIGRCLDIPVHALVEAVAGLAQKGLVHRAPHTAPGDDLGHWLPAPPELAVGMLLLQRQQQLELARQSFKALLHEHRNSHATPVSVAEVIGPELSARALPHVLAHRQACQEVLRLVRSPVAAQAGLIGDDHRNQARSRGVNFRTIVDPASAVDWVESARPGPLAGDEIRLLADLPFDLLVTDRSQALLPMHADAPQGPLLRIGRSAAVDALALLFERLWATATPVAQAPAGTTLPSDAEAAWPPALEPLVPLLAAGVQDKRIADQLGMSARTLMRRIESLYRTLGARTRFQAGWLAARHGRSAEPAHSTEG